MFNDDGLDRFSIIHWYVADQIHYSIWSQKCPWGSFIQIQIKHLSVCFPNANEYMCETLFFLLFSFRFLQQSECISHTNIQIEIQNLKSKSGKKESNSNHKMSSLSLVFVDNAWVDRNLLNFLLSFAIQPSLHGHSFVPHIIFILPSSFLHPSFIHSFDIRISKSYKLFVAFHLAMSIVSFCFERFAMWMNHTNHTIGLCLSTMSVVLFRFTLLLDESVVIINMVLPTESRDTTKEVEIWILKKRKNF